jgi:hypothetical protein
MTAQTSIEVRTSAGKAAAHVAVGLLLAVLFYRAGLFAAAGWYAVRYPWELDYGEGIVWQQMRWMFTARAYGPIDGFPAIVFHYPPLYHTVTAITAAVLGTDQLATGRAISLLSTLAAAIASGILVSFLLEGRTTRADRLLCSYVGALLVFTYLPVVLWAPLMRVDMLAIAFGQLGLVAAFRSLDRPRAIYVASLLFVAAVFTKQTAIAAPAATFTVILVARPRLAFRGIATCLIVGLAVLLTLCWLTHGGFYRHIFLYNINRLEPAFLWRIVYVAFLQGTYFAFGGFVLVRRLAKLRLEYRSKADARATLGARTDDVRLLIAAGYLLISTLMLFLLAKSGSNINYCLDCFFALGPFAAMAPVEVENALRGKPELRQALRLVIPFGLAIGGLWAPLPRTDERADSPRAQQLAQLARMIAVADKPVISDDMVLLIRGGQEVRWEPAIFAELASTGRWDQRPFVQRIRNHEFAFFIISEDDGPRSIRQRYSPAVTEALNAEYPIRQQMTGLVIRRPRSALVKR